MKKKYIVSKYLHSNSCVSTANSLHQYQMLITWSQTQPQVGLALGQLTKALISSFLIIPLALLTIHAWFLGILPALRQDHFQSSYGSSHWPFLKTALRFSFFPNLTQTCHPEWVSGCFPDTCSIHTSLVPSPLICRYKPFFLNKPFSLKIPPLL